MVTLNARSQNGEAGSSEDRLPKAVVDAIVRALTGLRYGAVEITVHDEKVVQIERREKVRLPSNESKHDDGKGR